MSQLCCKKNQISFDVVCKGALYWQTGKKNHKSASQMKNNKRLDGRRTWMSCLFTKHSQKFRQLKLHQKQNENVYVCSDSIAECNAQKGSGKDAALDEFCLFAFLLNPFTIPEAVSLQTLVHFTMIKEKLSQNCVVYSTKFPSNSFQMQTHKSRRLKYSQL